jgi:cell division protein FtsI (penicillin-binding protein 3)
MTSDAKTWSRCGCRSTCACQHIVRDELAAAMERYRAIAAGAVVLDVHTGEVIAMSSLPDYNPNNPVEALDKDRMNRMSAGTYEMGSTFKTFTTAMALDSGLVRMGDSFDASRPIRIGGHTISDFHGKHRVLTVPEIFIYSSNIGTAKMADVVGIEGHKEFLARIGLLSRMQTQLPEVAMPTQPSEWKKIHSVTISFGHGATTTPLQTAVAAAALMNGGKLIPPSFVPRSREAGRPAGEAGDQRTDERGHARAFPDELDQRIGSSRRSRRFSRRRQDRYGGEGGERALCQ